jgi:hypothetical protein
VRFALERPLCGFLSPTFQPAANLRFALSGGLERQLPRTLGEIASGIQFYLSQDIDIQKKYGTIIIMDIIIVIAIYLLFVLFSQRIWYFILYKPLYITFGDNIYLSFYLYLAIRLIIFLSFFILCFVIQEFLTLRIVIIINSIILIYAIIILKNPIKDIKVIKHRTYMKITCDLNSLVCYRIKGYKHFKKYYEIKSIAKTDGENIFIRMDFYQYNKLKK